MMNIEDYYELGDEESLKKRISLSKTEFLLYLTPLLQRDSPFHSHIKNHQGCLPSSMKEIDILKIR